MFSTPAPLTVVNLIVGADYTESAENNLKAATIKIGGRARVATTKCPWARSWTQSGKRGWQPDWSSAEPTWSCTISFTGFHLFICSCRSHQPEISAAVSQLLVQLIKASHAASPPLQPTQAQLQAHVCFCCWRDHLKGNSSSHCVWSAQLQHTSDSWVLPNGPTSNRQTLRPNGGFASKGRPPL